MRGRDSPTNAKARRLREHSTDAEHKLWYSLRNRSLNGYKFVRQAPVGHYIADFMCREKKLIVEADGSQHFACAKDAIRDAWLTGEGYFVLRIGNAGIMGRHRSVLETIVEALEGRLEAQQSAEITYRCPPR